MFLGSDNSQAHKVLININIKLQITSYVNRHICKRHRIINRDINIRAAVQSNDKKKAYYSGIKIFRKLPLEIKNVADNQKKI
jgi:hypothetical protein